MKRLEEAPTPSDIHYEVWYMHDGHIIDKINVGPIPAGVSPTNVVVAIENGVVRALTPYEHERVYR